MIMIHYLIGPVHWVLLAIFYEQWFVQWLTTSSGHTRDVPADGPGVKPFQTEHLAPTQYMDVCVQTGRLW